MRTFHIFFLLLPLLQPKAQGRRDDSTFASTATWVFLIILVSNYLPIVLQNVASAWRDMTNGDGSEGTYFAGVGEF